MCFAGVVGSVFLVAAGCDVLCPAKSLSVVLVILKTVSLLAALQLLLAAVFCLLWFFLILLFGELGSCSEDVFCKR